MKKPNLLISDNPWWFNDVPPRVGAKYGLMKDDELLGLAPYIQAATSDHCVHLMWAVGPRLDFAFEVMRVWGFRYITVAFNWSKVSRAGKPRMGGGGWTRASSEFCLIGVKPKACSVRRQSRAVRQFIQDCEEHPGGYELETERPKKHSEKPDKFYEAVNELLPQCDVLEIFARREQPGGTNVKGVKFKPWTCLGGDMPEGHPSHGEDIRDSLIRTYGLKGIEKQLWESSQEVAEAKRIWDMTQADENPLLVQASYVAEKFGTPPKPKKTRKQRKSA